MQRTLIVAAALALIALNWPGDRTAGALAQEQPAAGPTSQPQQRESRQRDGSLINLDFKGGTAAQYIESLRKAGGDINIVVMGDASAIEVPAMRLNNVDAWSAISVLQSVPEVQGSRGVQVRVTREGGSGAGELPVYIVHARSVSMSRATGAPEVIVFDISDLLSDTLKPEDLLTAVQASLDLMGDQTEPAQFRFHESTGLLIARGTQDQLSAVSQVTQQVRGRVERMRALAEMDLRKKLEQLNAMEVSARSQLADANKETQAAQQKLTECMINVDALQQQVKRMEREFEEAKSRLHEELAHVTKALRERESTIDALNRQIMALQGEKKPS